MSFAALDTERMTDFLQTEGLMLDIRDVVDSTNAVAKAYGEHGAPEGTVVIADSQTAGRGTRGRSFFSPDGTGLYISILLRPNIPATEALSITTAAAVAVSRAIESVSDRSAYIKWVNDIYCDEKKVCGILTEASVNLQTGALDYAVLGIGVNVCDPTGGFPAEIADIAASVFGRSEGDRCRLAAAILNEFFAIYRMLSSNIHTNEYRERSLLIGRRITVKTTDGDRAALVTDIDEQCRLRVRYDDGTEGVLSSGDVSIRI